MTMGPWTIAIVSAAALLLGGCPGDDGGSPGDGSGSSTSDPTGGGPTTGSLSISDTGGSTADPDGTSTGPGPTDSQGTDTEGSTTETDTDDPTGGVDPPIPVDTVDCGEIPPGMVVGGEVGPLGFGPPCSPRAENTSAAYTCCSDDPAAPGGALPAYTGFGGGDEAPLFADDNNDLGAWGLCVDTSMIPAGSGLFGPAADNCPVPCDPTWDAASVEEICGPARVCCQTQQLQPEDCVLEDWEGQAVEPPWEGEWDPGEEEVG